MPTAKTYENFPLDGEPFKENGRMYVNITTPKGIKKVRWYSDAEYQKMYPEVTAINDFNANYAFGFREEGFITLYKGDEDAIRNWAQAEWPPKAWYNTLFHFYTPGFMPITNLPNTITPIKLTWDEVKLNETQMKDDNEIEKYVMARITGLDHFTSEFQGEKDTWLEKEVTISKNTKSENYFGEKHTHIMHDAEGNIYVWETGAKNFEVGMVIKLKMKVKAHKEINGEKCTVVWYCKEI